jgi:hypothetical protein
MPSLLGNLFPTPEEIALHLARLIELLQKYPHYELALPGRMELAVKPDRFYLNLKEDLKVIFATWDEAGNHPLAIATGEATILQAFQDYYDKLWGLIPHNHRSKEWVINKLQSTLEILQKMTDATTA